MRTDWQGVFTALITPFKENGDLDETGMAKLVRRQIEAGIHGLVPCGTTGETPTLSEEEWAKVIEITIKEAAGKCHVIAGTGSNDTKKAIKNTQIAMESGADGALIVTPYYNKPTQEGIKLHFQSIAENVPGFPILMYNIPGRSGVNITPKTIEELLSVPEIAGVKEASGDLSQIWDLVKRCGRELVIFSGDDGMNLPVWEVGGVGTISVLSNVIPLKVLELWEISVSGEADLAYQRHNELLPMIQALFMETSPTPVKYALAQLGLPSGPVRLPLAPVREATRKAILDNLIALGVL